MDLALRDEIVFVTGASGGIGSALATAFLGEGALVALGTRRPLEPRGPRSRVVTVDVTRPAELAAAMDDIVAAWGRLDVCVVNAGIWPESDVPLHELDERRIREVLEVDLLGALWTARAFLSALARTGPRPDGRGASLVFIGSTAARFGERGHAEYAVAKAGLYGLVRSLKNEIVALDPRGRVNLVEPGWTVTEMARQTLERSGMVERVTRTMPLRQIGSPEDVARAVLFLASPAARHVTGESLTVAGGMEGRVLW